MATECWLGLLMGPDGKYAVGGVVGVPQCGSRGFGSEDNRGGEQGGKNRVHMYVVINQSSPSTPYLYFPLPLSSVPSSIYQNI